MRGFEERRLEQFRAVMANHTADGSVSGVAWLAARDDEVEVGLAGSMHRDREQPVARDTIFRIASMTKPIVAVAALILVEECRIRLDDPVDNFLPELADRRVLVDGRGPLDGPTVPANRPITLHDLLTFRLGIGMDFGEPWPQPFLDASGDFALGGDGPPRPQEQPDPDEWMKRLGSLPLMYQPGEKWLYNTGADVLGVLIARASGQSLGAFLADRICGPLGMRDTRFSTTDTTRLSSCYTPGPEVFDAPDGHWSKPPAFEAGGGGLLSTLDDYFAFAQMLLAGGRLPDGSRLLSRASVEAMTTAQVLTGVSADDAQGWGFGTSVQLRRTGLAPGVGSYGWAGGLGTSWANDPHERLIGIVLTTDAFAGAFPPPAIVQDFWTGCYASLV